MAQLIGITGATGQIGSRVAQKLTRHDVHQRLIVRDVERAPKLAGVEVVEFGGYLDKAGMTEACDGVHTLFLVSGHLSDDRVKEHKTAVDAAVAAGVSRIVYLSFLNAAADAAFLAAREHFQTEEYIRSCDVAFTFMRAGLYADSAVRYASEDGVIRGPAGDGKVSYVARDDIADAIVVVLTSAGHGGKTYSMTGSKAYTLDEAAALLTEFTGRECSYYNETMEEARQSRAKYGAPYSTVDFWISTYTAIAVGEMDTISDDIEQLTGRRAQTLREFLEANPESYAHLKTE